MNGSDEIHAESIFVLELFQYRRDTRTHAHNLAAESFMHNRYSLFRSTRGRVLLPGVLLIVTLLIVGCRPSSESDTNRPAATKSTAGLLRDGITGKAAVDAGKRAKTDIEAMSEQHNTRFQELLEE
ncbi:MAG: hypothetical protein ACNA71_06115 [Kiritimatiellia bacterium]